MPPTPTALVVIPARGGSQGIPLKNLQRIGGVSLVGRAVQTSLAAPSVTAVVVSTDHEGIADEARAHGARVIERPAEISGSTASSESAVLHAVDAVADAGEAEPDIVVLMQATSPFIDPQDLDEAISKVTSGQHDVVVAVAPTHDFQWRLDGEVASPVGHTTEYRPRRQERAAHFRETGAFYVMRTAGLREHGTRFFGDVGLQATAEEWAVELDEPRDLWLARRLLDQPGPEDATAEVEPAIDVDALVTDFDGVHTDDNAWVDQHGTEQVRVGRGDGMGIKLLRRTGLPILILSTEANPVVAARGAKLQVQVLQGLEDKTEALREWIAERGLNPARVAYVGNDVNDLGPMAVVGWPIAVADARPEAKAAARLILSRSGGDGAVREVCDRIRIARED